MSDEPTLLDTEIRARIAREGPIPVSEFMTMCLYDPRHGYYNSRPAFGVAGDFITAPEISQMFGELIGLWTASVWRLLGQPDPLIVIELGPGRGTMMADALRALRTVPQFRKAAQVHFVESSADLQQRQRRTLAGVGDVALHWHRGLDEVPAGPTIVLANEFFDALPIRQAERCADGWHERLVGINAGGAFALTVGNEPLADFDATLPPALRKAPAGSIFEWRSDSFAVEIARRVAPMGAALLIDYGHIKSAPGDTFQAVRSHRYASPFAFPGLTDLTAHVDFEALGRAAQGAGARRHGPLEQGAFLKRIGIEARATALAAHAPEDKRPAITAALDRLVGNGATGMGTMFKVIGLSSPQLNELPGFDP
jgi:NADH dehydrogenase [ubiquinone] 1 alpha subcomplex assembly factor 7